MGNQCLDVKSKEYYNQDNILIIKIKTWNKEAHHLFDYSNDKLKKEQILTIQENGLVIKYQNSFRLITNYSQFKKLDRKKIQFAVDISKYDHHFEIMKYIPKDDGCGLNNLWQVVSKDMQIRIEVNDIFKLGRVRFKVVDIVLNQNEVRNTQLELQQQNQNQCKICYEKSSTKSNPLITPCGCTGSVQFIHINCLREWLQKISDVKRTQNSIEIPVKDHKCQLCDKNIKQVQIFQGNSFNSYYNEVKLKPPYIQLHILSKQHKTPKYIYYYSFANSSNVFIGRGSSAGIRVKDDISISRQHSFLNLQDGKIFLSDYNSKFGTLKLIKSSLKFEKLKESTNDYIQMNNHLFSIETKPRYGKPNYEQRKRTEAQLQRILNEQKQIKESDQIQSDVSEESVIIFEQDQP